MGKATKNNVNEIKKEMIDYLMDKYGGDFEAQKLIQKSLNNNYDELFVIPKKGNPNLDVFSVFRYIDESGQHHLKDNYFSLIIKEKYEAFTLQISGTSNEKSKCYSEFNSIYFPENKSFWPNELNRNSTLQDSFDLGTDLSSQTFIFITDIEKQEFEKITSKVEERFKTNQLNGTFVFFLVTEHIYDEINQLNYKNVLNDYFEPDGDLCLEIYRISI